jgi:tetratricopeptide (TPR) repeat protein
MITTSSRGALCVVALAVSACSPQDVLRHQGQTLKRTDYVQVAVEEQKKRDAERAEQARKEADERESIQRHADKAQAHMDLFEYDAALESYKEAYRLSQDPQYLVKIAEGHRRTGDCAEARAMYSQYLEKRKDAPDAKTVKARIAEAKSCETRAGSNIGEVRRLYGEGATHYELAEYDRAVTAFKEAYRLSKDPTYLFNIAQAYRMARNCSEAMTFYQRFLKAETEVANRSKIEARIQEMRACAR